MDKDRRYASASGRDKRDGIPALMIFAGTIVAFGIGIVDPSKLYSVGGVVLAGFAVTGFVVRLLIPKESEEQASVRQTFDLVIFDCDGVLVDSESISVAVEARVLTELGWPIQAPEVARRWMGRSSADQLADVADRLGPEMAQKFDELTTAETRTEFERSLGPVDGVLDLLEHLDAAGLRYCVASSSSHQRMRLTLGVAGLIGRFGTSMFSAEEVPRGKPEPDLFLYAAQKLGVPAERCVVIEDSVYGVQAAQRAGMAVFAYAGGLTEARALTATGATVVHDLRDLVAVLERRDDA